MKEFLRVKSGVLIGGDQSIPIHFGIVFNDDGVYHLDLYVHESINLRELYDDKTQNFFRHFFNLEATTVENNQLTVERLSVDSIPFDQHLIKLTCNYRLIHRETSHRFYKPGRGDEKKPVYYIEVEGLKMQFTNHTESSRIREGKRIDEINDINRDHTRGIFALTGKTKEESFNVNWIWQKKENSENIMVAIQRSEANLPLLFETWSSFRNEFVYFLGLMNGAEVRIRKEYFGNFYSTNKPSAEDEITYSFLTIVNKSLNEYVPLNDLFHWGDDILNKFFLFSFRKFLDLNKRFDFVTTIFYLNGAQKSRNLAQRFFIEIIALERLARKSIEGLELKDETWIEESAFSTIQADLMAILKKNAEVLGKAMPVFEKKIRQLNIKKVSSVGYKFYYLLQEANIEITPQIRHILEIVRHKSIHYGDIGKGEEAYWNVQVLDTLIRDIILNLIEYKGPRLREEGILKFQGGS